VQGVHVVDHPVLAEAMTVLRAVDTPRAEFRTAMSEAAAMLAYEATRGLPQRDIEVLTPLETTSGRVVDRPIMVVAVLRAGLGMVEGFLRLVPDAAVGHLGMRRNEQTLRPDGYYESLPEGVADSVVFVVDPMLATGGSASAALTRLREVGARDLRLVALLAAPEGLEAVRAIEPDIPITIAALDRGLNAQGFIEPGLGDAGDRIFGTE
jgi:uracil phosphoribosyltransferase